MHLIRLAEPSDDLVSLDGAKTYCRVDGSDSDSDLEGMIAAATSALDGPSGLLGRALITQSWALKMPAFCRRIELPLPPLQSVDAVKYVDTFGQEQTLDPATYVVSGVGRFGAVELADDAAWPETASHPEAVSVEFTAGYGDTAADVPQALTGAAKAHVAWLYDNRGGGVPPGYEDTLSPYRVDRV